MSQGSIVGGCCFHLQTHFLFLPLNMDIKPLLDNLHEEEFHMFSSGVHFTFALVNIYN